MSAGQAPTLPLTPEHYLDHLQADLAAIAAVPSAALTAAIEACDGWSVADAISHLGRVLGNVTKRLEDPQDRAAPVPEIADGADPIEYFSTHAAHLIATLETTDPTEARANWSGDPAAAFYWRRMAHETLIHRHDVEAAIGDPAAIDPLMAVDGLDELCSVVLPHSGRRLGLPTGGETVHLHVTDPEVGDTLPAGEFMLTFTEAGVVTETTHRKGDMAFRGRAVDLLLFAWNRSTAGVDAFGADDPISWWRTNIRV